MTMSDPNNKMLDDLFAQVRETQPVPSEALLMRVMADAAHAQPVAKQIPATKQGFWAQVAEAIGGWPSVGGLVAATVAGVWIGVAPPSSVEEFTASLVGDQVSLDPFSASLGFVEGDLVDG